MRNALRNLPAILLLALCSLLCQAQAGNQYVVVVNLTGNPADGNTLVVDGTTATFKTTVTSPSTQIVIGASATETAANIVAHFQAYPLTKVYPFGDTSTATRLYLAATEIDFVMTTSMTGSWGTSTVSITSINTYSPQLPLSGLPATQHRTNMANWLVLGLRDYSDTNFPSTAGVLVNFMSLSEAQTITGLKTFSGANVYSNANQVFTSGRLSNVTARAVHLSRSLGETNNGIYFYDSSSNIVAALAPNANGRPSLYIAESLTYPLTDPLSFTPTAAEILTAGIADFRYGRKDATNTWTGSNTFTGLVILQNFGGVGSGLDLRAVTNAYITNLYMFGDLKLSNAAPTLLVYDTDADADEKIVRMRSVGGYFVLEAWDDADITAAPFLEARRTGITIDETTISGTAVGIQGQFRAYNGGQFNASLGVAQIFGVGTTNPLAPAGMTAGIIITNSTAASADPANATARFTVGGEEFYRAAAANEGSGRNNRTHNRSSQVQGSGTDYTFTTSYAQVTFGSGGNTITLPTDGTYLVTAVVTIDAGGTANDDYAVKLYNSTAAADVSNSERQLSNLAASTRDQVTMQNVITVSTASTIQLHGKNITAARGTIDSEQTSLSYVRLY